MLGGGVDRRGSVLGEIFEVFLQAAICFPPDKVYISLALLTQQPLDSAEVWEISTPCYAQLTLPFQRTTLLLYPAWVYNNLFPRQLTTPLQLNIAPVCVGQAEAVTPWLCRQVTPGRGRRVLQGPCKPQRLPWQRGHSIPATAAKWAGIRSPSWSPRSTAVLSI